MKLKKEFITHTSRGEHIMIASDKGEFSGLVYSNATAATIIEMLKNEITKEKIVKMMCKKYDAPTIIVEQDVENIIKTLRSIHALDE